jgi:hypothetical protein
MKLTTCIAIIICSFSLKGQFFEFFVHSSFVQIDSTRPYGNFTFANYEHYPVLLPSDYEHLSRYPMLSNQIFENTDIMKIKECGSPITDSLFLFLCEQDIINKWKERSSYFNDTYYFNSKEEYLTDRQSELKIFYIGTVSLDWTKYDSKLFLIIDDEPKDNGNWIWRFRKLLLVNTKNNQLYSLTIISIYNDFADQTSYCYSYCKKNNKYHFKGESIVRDVFFARKSDERKARNVDLGVLYMFDDKGFVRILKNYNENYNEKKMYRY